MISNNLYSHVVFDVPAKNEIIEWLEKEILSGKNVDCLEDLLIADDACFKAELLDILKRQKIEKPSDKTLGMVAAKWISKQIVDGSIGPYDGAEKIWQKIGSEFEEGLECLSIFTGLASQYDDFFDSAQLNFYGKDQCEVIQKETLEKIVDEARSLLSQ